LAAKTISYAAAKTIYYEALRAAAPELMDIATGKKPRSPEVDQFAQSFSLAGEKQEKVLVVARPDTRGFDSGDVPH
jgi:hypothetical protein